MTDSGVPLNKASVNISKLKEALQVSDTGRGFLVFDSRDLFWIYFDIIRRDNKDKEGGFCFVEFTFFRFNI